MIQLISSLFLRSINFPVGYAYVCSQCAPPSNSLLDCAGSCDRLFFLDDSGVCKRIQNPGETDAEDEEEVPCDGIRGSGAHINRQVKTDIFLRYL